MQYPGIPSRSSSFNLSRLDLIWVRFAVPKREAFCVLYVVVKVREELAVSWGRLVVSGRRGCLIWDDQMASFLADLASLR
jgi:hypothetical protein